MSNRVLLVSVFSVLFILAKAEITLPPIISNHMVLQKGVKVHIWGKAVPNESVTVAILDQKKSTIANNEGKWELWLDPLQSAKPVEMNVSGHNTIVVSDILIGDVWVGAGQSNMEWSVKQSDNAVDEIANSANSQIRVFKIRKCRAEFPADQVLGEWKLAGPGVIDNFSGGLYFFGRELYKARKQALGLIEASWGATPGQSWLSKSIIESNPNLKYILDDWSGIIANYPKAIQQYNIELDRWCSDSAQNNATLSFRPKPRMPIGAETKELPGSIYNGMIAPLSPFVIKGVLWYQGEANAYEKLAFPYRHLLKSLILDWRNAWNIGQFPFIIAQLSTLSKHPYWPVMRESQAEALKIPKTALVVTIDIGDSTNAHFKNKQELGRRFSLAARKIAYNENIEYSGPSFYKAFVQRGKIKLTFKHNNGLRTKGDTELTGFTIAGADGIYYSAKAEIVKNTIFISAMKVLKPISVRYAFTDAPVCNLVNEVGLPAVPFRVTVK